MIEMKATFCDRWGEESITIRSTGTSLETVIRGVRCAGKDFDGLTPDAPCEEFDLSNFGELCGFTLCVDMPVRLKAPEGLRHVIMKAEITIGLPSTNGGVDRVDIHVGLCEPEVSIFSRGSSGEFEGELLSLIAQLPQGFAFETCFTCGLSDYSPGGNGAFGCLACFRDVAEAYREVKSKEMIFALWDRLTEYVQETHYCPQYEPRPKGRGHRG